MKLIVNLVILGVMVLAVWATWTPSAGYQPAVEAAGYKDVEMGTYSFFYCPKGEIGYDFKATINDRRIDGVVCRSHMFWGSYQVRTL